MRDNRDFRLWRWQILFCKNCKSRLQKRKLIYFIENKFLPITICQNQTWAQKQQNQLVPQKNLPFSIGWRIELNFQPFLFFHNFTVRSSSINFSVLIEGLQWTLDIGPATVIGNVKELLPRLTMSCHKILLPDLNTCDSPGSLLFWLDFCRQPFVLNPNHFQTATNTWIEERYSSGARRGRRLTPIMSFQTRLTKSSSGKIFSWR